MIVNECSRDELKDLFSSGLSDLIRDDEVKVHVVGVLDGFICERNLPIKQTVADSVIVNDLFEKRNYEALVFFGDAQLFMCGMFPEYLSKHRRHSLGIGFYVRKGIDSYNYALYLAISKKMKNGKLHNFCQVQPGSGEDRIVRRRSINSHMNTAASTSTRGWKPKITPRFQL